METSSKVAFVFASPEINLKPVSDALLYDIDNMHKSSLTQK